MIVDLPAAKSNPTALFIVPLLEPYSATSFPSISWCLGTHIRMILFVLLSLLNAIMQSHTTDDSVLDLISADMAALLSVQIAILQFVFFFLERSVSMQLSIADTLA